ncbi:MAG: FkbM family methyltransferase [Acetobacteraceae bacterium]
MPTFDGGDNIGLVTLLMAMHRPAGHVFAVEPVPENVRYLRRNLELNGIRNCTVIEAAVGRTDDEVRVHPQGAYSYVVRDPRETAADARVSLRTLDGLAASVLAGRRLSFAKIDVEGFEPDVLDGARRLIGRDRPWIFMEFNSWCLWSLHAYDQCALARALWDSFEVSTIDESGHPVPAFGGDPDTFLRHNATHGFVDDLLLRLQDRHDVPALEAMTSSRSAWCVRRDLEALRSSTSWKVTAPLRALSAAVGPRRWRRWSGMGLLALSHPAQSRCFIARFRPAVFPPPVIAL